MSYSHAFFFNFYFNFFNSDHTRWHHSSGFRIERWDGAAFQEQHSTHYHHHHQFLSNLHSSVYLLNNPITYEINKWLNKEGFLSLFWFPYISHCLRCLYGNLKLKIIFLKFKEIKCIVFKIYCYILFKASHSFLLITHHLIF